MPFSLPASFRQYNIYQPLQKPGFVCWATAFTYGDGSIGLAFDEVVQKNDPGYAPPSIAFCEAAGVPVSYCSVECGSSDKYASRVYMRSSDGIHFTETGRTAKRDGSFCNIGFPDGRIIGLDVPRWREDGTGWARHIRIRESTDGGNTWQDRRHLLEGTAPYLWRVRRLHNGTIIVLASFYGTPWGKGQTRPTRNTMLPDETYLQKIQTFFLTSHDGVHYSEPHYVLPGLGAHEYDFVELPDGRLLFIAGDVQGTPTGRQFVTPSPDGWINGTLYPILTGSPPDPQKNPQGGFVPETLVWSGPLGGIIGYRRNKGYSVSGDFGRTWTMLAAPENTTHLYQPFLLALPDGSMCLYGHIGGDNAFGETEMSIGLHHFFPDIALPKTPSLSLERLLAKDGTRYTNRFGARLTVDALPLKGCNVIFRFSPYWNADGSVNTSPQSLAPWQISVQTDSEGWAEANASSFDGIADIHLAYQADVVYLGENGISPCAGPSMTVLALTPRKETPYPYEAFFAGGVLYLSPDFLNDFPDAIDRLNAILGDEDLVFEKILSSPALQRLVQSGVLQKDINGHLRWVHSVHAPHTLEAVRPMSTADWYI